jgi:hypothetical protein
MPREGLSRRRPLEAAAKSVAGRLIKKASGDWLPEALVSRDSRFAVPLNLSDQS